MDVSTVTTGSGPVHLTADFLAEIDRRFSVGPRMLRKILEGRKVSNSEPKDWTELTNGSELGKSYLHFVLSNVVRGRMSRDTILKRYDREGGRYLDVGCAYGGFVIAFAEAGFAAEGIEIDAHWTEVGSLNCDERGYPGIIRQADIYDLSSDPAYDIITCNDVIEHVHRPREALAKMASMLRPGGLLYLAIPNRLSIKHVLRDGHYHLFGLNLLEHYAARAYFDAYSSRFPGKSYSCGEMYPFEWYQHTLGGLGLSVERLPSQKIDAQKMKETFFECEERIRTRHQFAAVDEKLQETIIERFADYAGDFWRSLSLYQAKGAGEFIRDYADDFWTVICRKTR